VNLGLLLIAVGVVIGAATLAVTSARRGAPLTPQRRTAALLLAVAGVVLFIGGVLLG
jgi:hypothetical protein